MSATRDQDQKISFIYSDLHALYKKGKEAARNASSGRVIKAGSLPPAEKSSAQVSEFKPASLIAKRISEHEPRGEAAPQRASLPLSLANQEQRDGVAQLRTSLQELDALSVRLRVLLQDLEEITDARKKKVDSE